MFLLRNVDISVIDGVFFSIIAMLIVFAVLTILVLCVAVLSKIKFKKAKPEEKAAPTLVAAPQKKLSIDDIKDEDMMVAALVATVDYIEETKKTDARVVSIKQIG